MSCDHKFVDSSDCLKCGISIQTLVGGDRAELVGIAQQQKLELAKLRDAFLDALALLRDWEDSDPADEQCTWQSRREEFLTEHEGAGR